MEKYYIATISAIKHFGSVRVQKLLGFFCSAKSAWLAERVDLEKVGLPLNVVESFESFRQKNPNAPDKLVEYCAKNKVKLCSIVDDDYPSILKAINKPPLALYYYGQLQSFAERIAMIGTRNNTEQGKRAALEISEGLASAGITIVSGAARGIDTYSHIGAMKYGRTVAVLGGGMNFAFDRPDGKFIRDIAEKGVVMTEYPPAQAPSAKTFPLRNRIIAGLSRCVLVVEAGKTGGTMITCNYAKKFGREILAQGNSEGCNDLIGNGAISVRNAADVLTFFNGR